MRSRILCLILLICCATLTRAQDKLFERYADEDGVSYVYISKKMFQMMPAIETAGLKVANLKGKIESMQVLNTERSDLGERMKKEFGALIGKDHEELMRVRGDGSKVDFYAKQEGELIRELIMLSDNGDDGFSVIRLQGRFTLDDIQEITAGSR